MKTSCSGVITSVCERCLSLEAATVQLDFLSWHIYSNDPNDYVKGARHYRACLDSSGYTNTELHVTEYNTDNRSDNDIALRAYLPGAAINTAAWIAMQQENIALATIYRGPDPDITAPFFYGILYADAQPKAAALAAMLCNTIAGFSNRLQLTSSESNLWAIAGQTSNSVAVLLSNPTTNTLSWSLALSDGRVPQQPNLIEIVPSSTNRIYTNVIYWALSTNALTAEPVTIGPWGVQLVTFTLLSDYDHWAQTLNHLTGPHASPDSDPDNDSASNWAEFTAGTNPTNPMSRLQIDTISAVSGNILLQWTAVTGKTYRVQTAPDINSPELWYDVSTDIQAGSFIHSNVTSQTQFYRLQVLEP